MSVDLHPYLSICSGAGGLDTGVDRGSGGTTVPVCYVERESSAAATLVHNIAQGTLADAPIWSDIKTFDFAAWRGQVEGIVGGYPCQPFSAVGPKLGSADPRHLWPDIEAGINAAQPVWVFFENVAHHLSLGFSEVAISLQGMGYEVAATLLTAEETGAPHRRQRLFILGYASGARFKGPSFQRSNNIPDRPQQGEGQLSELEREVANTPGNGRKEEAISIVGSSGRSAIEMERPSRFAYGPTDPRWVGVAGGLQPSLLKSEFLRVDDGMGHWLDIGRNDRIRIIGNGVVHDAAALAWHECWEALTQ